MQQMSLKQVRKVLKKEFKGKATNESGTCFYLQDNGNKCAIGCFIPDGHKAQNSCSDAENLLMREFPEILDYMPTDNLELLQDWQHFHDGKLSRDFTVDQQRDALFNEYVKLLKKHGIEDCFKEVK